jgi:hypothetical protein
LDLHSNLRRLLVSAALVALAATARVARADDVDVVTTKSGTELRGIVVSDDDKGVTIQTLDGATHTIPRSEVESVALAKNSTSETPPSKPDEPPPEPPKPPASGDHHGDATDHGAASEDGGEDHGNSAAAGGDREAAGWSFGLVANVGVSAGRLELVPLQAGLTIGRGLGRIAAFELDLQANFTPTSKGATLGGLAVTPGVLFHLGDIYTMSVRVPLDLLFTAGGRFGFFSEYLGNELQIHAASFGNPTFRMDGMFSPAGVRFGSRKQHRLELAAGGGFFLYDKLDETFTDVAKGAKSTEVQPEFYASLRYAFLF